MKKKGTAAYIYIGFFLCAVLIILIGNSYFLIDRTRSNLIEIYWKQGELIVKSIAVSAQQSIDSVRLTSHQLKRYLNNAVEELDRYDSGGEIIDAREIREILRKENIFSIRILDQEDNLVFYAARDNINAEKPILEEELASNGDYRTVRIERKTQPGSVLVTVGPEKQIFIKAQIGLQLLIASLENRNIVQYISFIDENFRIVADSDPIRIGVTEEEIEYLDVLESGVSYFFRDSDEDVMKILHPMDFTPNNRGILKIAYPITRIDKIYENTFKSVILNSSVVMIIAIIAAAVAVQLNRRNVEKIESMERQIRENAKLASLANLTAGVAHEVRNPLNSVAITIQRLQLEFTPKNDEDLEEYTALTDLMKQEVDRINLIITDFLDFAKPFEPRKSRFAINDFLASSVSLIGAEAEEKGVRLLANNTEKDLTFLGDREKLSQVLINILRNALDASSPADTITIESRINKDQSCWELQIKDNGHGISKENLNHIFDIYFTTKQNGTGLGLYICRKIIQAHKGKIDLQPNPGTGITVSISLPFLEY